MTTFARFNCAICLGWLEDDQTIVATHCGHVFHEACVDAGLRTSSRCACCREVIGDLHRLHFSSAPFNRTDLQDDLDRAYKTIDKLQVEKDEAEAQIRSVVGQIGELNKAIDQFLPIYNSFQEQLAQTRQTVDSMKGRLLDQEKLLKKIQHLETIVRDRHDIRESKENDGNQREIGNHQDDRARHSGHEHKDFKSVREMWEKRLNHTGES
ncbi:hypothetical protein QR680_003566 [Steinernema hermaphroditum]|uniref:RING-type domain-containing protein n=1 Tax=Steinernema hermaphroditum TaxID=289476 RepID=A0AA39LRS1_9BILA|nr:hypothetical protein QR680_003566 [Steinernema hermaphroditum]